MRLKDDAAAPEDEMSEKQAQYGVSSLQEVYDRYKYMGALLSDRAWWGDSVWGHIISDLWDAIKREMEGELSSSGHAPEVQHSSTLQAYNRVLTQARSLMLAKNHDYGESWREMRPHSITDQILVKVRRIKQLEDLAAREEGPRVSEGIEEEYRDILNYAIFALIRISEDSSA